MSSSACYGIFCCRKYHALFVITDYISHIWLVYTVGWHIFCSSLKCFRNLPLKAKTDFSRILHFSFKTCFQRCIASVSSFCRRFHIREHGKDSSENFKPAQRLFCDPFVKNSAFTLYSPFIASSAMING